MAFQYSGRQDSTFCNWFIHVVINGHYCLSLYSCYDWWPLISFISTATIVAKSYAETSVFSKPQTKYDLIVSPFYFRAPKHTTSPPGTLSDSQGKYRGLVLSLGDMFMLIANGSLSAGFSVFSKSRSRLCITQRGGEFHAEKWCACMNMHESRLRSSTLIITMIITTTTMIIIIIILMF